MYMSPEQVLTPQSVGPASDLFSIGSVLYYLATGVHAFAGSSMHKVLKNVTEVKCPSLHETRNDISRDFSDIVHKLLQRDPERRYGSARQVAKELSAFMRSRGENDPRHALSELVLPPQKMEPRHTTIVLLQKKNKPANPILAMMDGPPIPLDRLKGEVEQPRPQVRLGVLFWSVIVATAILLAGLAVAEIDALHTLREWLQHELSR